MKINGNSEGGTGGGLTPQQEALLNQVPQKVNQVRLVTDGQAIRHEGALQPLTFNQIYELVMDNSKYVYIVMDNNIRFRPSAYDGTAIWFDSSFIEEGKPNILRCIINSNNRVDITQIVVASEDYVADYVDEHSGGLTPEQQKALEPMFNTKGGILKTTEFKAGEYVYQFKTELRTVFEIASNEQTVPDELWFKYSDYGKIGVFNPVTLEVIDYKFNEDPFDNYFFWKDNSGRLYFGSFELDLDTLTYEDKVTNGLPHSYNQVPSIFRFGGEILNIYGNIIKIFNEETQSFEDCNLDGSEGYAYTDDLMKYEGEIVSSSQGVKLVKVADKSYKWESWTPDFNTTTEDGNDVQPKNVHYVDGLGYFLAVRSDPSYVYKLQGTEWVKFDVIIKEGSDQATSVSSIGKFLVMKSYVNFSLIACDDVKSSTWSDISSEYVTLNTYQNITAQKNFDYASFNQASIHQVQNVNQINHEWETDLKIALDDNKLNIEGKSINLNGIELPTKNDLYINSETRVGDGFVKLTNNIVVYYNTGKLRGDIFSTWGGTTARKWNGTDWEYPELPFEFDQPLYRFKETTSHSVYFDGAGNIWEYAGGQFTMINDSGFITGDYVYPLGENLVLGGSNWYFDFNSNTWVEGSITFTNYDSSYIKMIGGITYYNQNQELYRIELDGTSTLIGNHPYMNYAPSYFEYAGDIYFVCNDGVYKLVKETNEFIKTDFYYKKQEGVYFEYNGKLYYSCDPDGTGLVQETIFTKPEVPAEDGNYVLRATRNGDTITYSWVSE